MYGMRDVTDSRKLWPLGTDGSLLQSRETLGDLTWQQFSRIILFLLNLAIISLKNAPQR